MTTSTTVSLTGGEIVRFKPHGYGAVRLFLTIEGEGGKVTVHADPDQWRDIVATVTRHLDAVHGDTVEMEEA